MNKLEIENKLKDNKLPEGWIIINLADTNYFKIVGSGIEFFKGNKNYLSTNSVQRTRITHIEETITYFNRPSRANIQPTKNRIAFAKMRNSIKVLYINEKLEKDYILSTGFSLFEVKIYPKYFYQYVMSRFFNHQKDLLAEGTTQEAISNDDFKRIYISFPPSITEQQKIAEILETVDQTIEKTDAIIEKYKRIKQGLMQDLFTKGIDEKGNIRSEKTHRFKDSPLGRIPEEWDAKTIKEICSLRRGASPRPIDNPAYFADSGRGWIRISDVTATYMYLKKTDQYLSNLGESLSVKVNPGDLIMSICATIGKPVILDIEACIHDGFVFFDKLKEGTNTKYLFYYLASKEEEINRNKQIGTQGNLNTTIVNSIFIPTPKNSKEQEQIAEILTNIDNTTDQESQKLLKLKRIKEGLMQDLLTGKVRVNHLIKEGVESVQKTG